MTTIKKKLAARVERIREDYGKIGFWAVYALVMPIIGLTALAAVILQAGPWFKSNPAGFFVFAIAVGLLCGFAILTTNVISIVAGWAFGFGFGLTAMMTGIAIAISINFFFSIRLAGANFDRILEQKPKIRAIHNELLAGHNGKVILIILLLRLSITPFAGTNYLIAASGVPFFSYFWPTVVGYIPRTAAAVFVGTTIERLAFDQPREPWILIVSVTATVAALIVISFLSKRALKRLTDVAA